MKINKLSIYKIIFLCYIIMIFFLKWLLNYTPTIKFSLIILPLIIVFCKKIDVKIILSVIILIIYYIINPMLTSLNAHYINEIFIYTIPGLSIALYYYVANYSSQNFKKFVKTFIFYFINIYMLINAVIMIIQLGNNYFLMFHSSNNMYYLDHITGMLGSNGTHRLSLVYIIGIYINYLYLNDDNKAKRLFSKIMFIFFLAFSIYFSAFNNNRAYYFLLLIFVLPLIIKGLKIIKKKSKTLFKTFIVLILGIITFLSFYNFNTNFKKFIDDSIINEVFENTASRFNASTQGNNISEERIDLFIYAIENGNGLFLGRGIGKVAILGDPTMPEHFGLSEITSRVYNGGIIYVVLITLVYYSFIITFFKDKKLWIKLFVFFSLAFMAAYQQIYTISEETFLVFLIYYFLSIIKNKEVNYEK